ncbi:hypothetical protein EX30DRAFT_394879 [Ascodesmis nigricans]|uniref:Uncharacterized protein n=1 Tax=Ascodesmis nigricans TaxID=341454 RepID=A0A4S2N0J9_9PEZI|nr:hypothetical protein EX30DRAFT_394879 [Ascodesmis nigricans]
MLPEHQPPPRERRASSVGSDENISGAKIAPLDSPVKRNTPHADSHGVIGDDEVIESTHIMPFPEHHYPPPPEHAGHPHKQKQKHPEQQGSGTIVNMGGIHHQRHHLAVEHGKEKMMHQQQMQEQGQQGQKMKGKKGMEGMKGEGMKGEGMKNM